MPPRRYNNPRQHLPWHAAIDAEHRARYMRGAWRRFFVRLRAHANWRHVARILAAVLRGATSRRILAAARALRR